MSTSALRIALGAQLNACARSMMVAWASVVAAVDEQLEVPAPIDFPAYSPAHTALVARIGELGRANAFELALLEREIERQAQTYRRTIEVLIAWRSKHAADPVSERYAHVQALAERVDAFVEALLSGTGEPEPPASCCATAVNVINEAGDVVQASARSTTGANGKPSLDVIVRRVGNTMARQIQSGQGALHGAIASRFGLNRRPGEGEA